MNVPLRTLGHRLLAGAGTLTLLAAVGLFSSRPAHTAGGPVPVTVANLPLGTAPTDEAAPRQPFQGTTTCFIRIGNNQGSLDYADGYADITVPAGKRLVIQTVSLYRVGARGQGLQGFVDPVVAGRVQAYALPLVPDSGAPYPAGALSATLSSTPGSTVTFSPYRNGTSGDEFIYFTLYGYLVDAP